jgi:hypothetical protein
MSYAFNSRLGEQLYRLLPEVYRTRDKKAGRAGEGSGTEDLAKYLDAHGHLLDLIHATLKQQFDDALPESSQDWLLPYFAQLLAAKIVSPDSKGKHAEIAHAVSWRQRKGTLKCAEEIAEAVGQMEVEIQEGWKRVAITPRIGMPLIPAESWDTKLDIDMTIPSEAMRHPTLPAAMVDLRRPSRAVEALPTNPAARVSSFGGVSQTWRQTNRHGVPCFPGSFDDVSRRTVDIRTPDAANGFYHHKRLLAYAPPPTGLFPLDPLIKTWDGALQENFIEVKHESGVLIYSNRTDRIIEITDKVSLEEKQYRIEGINFQSELEIPEGGKLVLIRSAAKSLIVNTELSYDDKGNVMSSLEATDCLFDNLTVDKGLARLEYCTVMDKADCKHLQASDCIFAGSIKNVKKPVTNMLPPSFLNCIRYSSVPVELMDDIVSKEQTDPVRKVAEALRFIVKNSEISLGTNTLETPIFPEFDYCKEVNGGWESIRRPAEFGDYGYGVLAPVTPDAIRFGAEDGGEMGAYHHKYYSLKAEAVLDKMREFLPIGIEPVLIHDTRLLRVPPEHQISEE